MSQLDQNSAIVAGEVVPIGARRPRRLRRSAALRGLCRETLLPPARLVLPLFIREGEGSQRTPIDAMPGVDRHTVDSARELIEQAGELGVRAFALFPKVEDHLKSDDALESANPENLICRALRTIRATDPDVCLISDVALDPFSSKGHDGFVGPGPYGEPSIPNDETVAAICDQAVTQAQAGSDVVAPSDMMDGRVAAIRLALDEHRLTHVAILSYAAKYASAFYGPFRSALDSAPVDSADIPKDKSTYQMDPANVREAMIEVLLDVEESADMVMVKPAGAYLDVIARVRDAVEVPVAAYQVSGEFAMLKASAERGWLDWDRGMVESLVGIARAGADIVLTYAALDYARWWRREQGG